MNSEEASIIFEHIIHLSFHLEISSNTLDWNVFLKHTSLFDFILNFAVVAVKTFPYKNIRKLN